VALLGRVEALWRYPVKSMQGEACGALELDRRGVAHDRLFALRTEDGGLGSGKRTRRFRRIDGLLGLRGAIEGGALVIELPSGRRLRGGDPGIDAHLSEALGRPVSLVRERAVRHLDAAPLHLLTTASLAWLAAALPGSAVRPERFRPNLLVGTDGGGPIEQGWIGRTLRLGPEAVIRVVAPTVRCRMVTLAQAGLPEDARILSHLARHAGDSFGVYAEVVSPGRVRCGDEVVDPDARAAVESTAAGRAFPRP